MFDSTTLRRTEAGGPGSRPAPKSMAMWPMTKMSDVRGDDEGTPLRICSDRRGHCAYRRWNAGSRGTQSCRVVGGRRAPVLFGIMLLLLARFIHRPGAQLHGK